ncbi:MAG: hypothetical protein AAFU79_32440, partial [Myxococcota bacterium]
MDVSGDDDYHSAAECIQAGMYWFSQSDFAAAEAWWRRALELEPDNARAASCLRLLQKTSSTGYKQDSWARMPAASGPPHAPRLEDPFAAPKPEAQEGPTSAYELLRPESSFSLDLASVEEEADEEAADLEPATSPHRGRRWVPRSALPRQRPRRAPLEHREERLRAQDLPPPR